MSLSPQGRGKSWVKVFLVTQDAGVLKRNTILTMVSDGSV